MDIKKSYNPDYDTWTYTVHYQVGDQQFAQAFTMQAKLDDAAIVEKAMSLPNPQMIRA